MSFDEMGFYEWAVVVGIYLCQINLGFLHTKLVEIRQDLFQIKNGYR